MKPLRLIPSAFLPDSDGQPATLPPSPTASHLGVVHVPEKAVGLGVQNKVPPQKLATVLILLDVQKPTDSVLPIHIRHSWALLTSPCMAGGREVLVREGPCLRTCRNLTLARLTSARSWAGTLAGFLPQGTKCSTPTKL